jgi:hypothetical protein
MGDGEEEGEERRRERREELKKGRKGERNTVTAGSDSSHHTPRTRCRTALYCTVLYYIVLHCTVYIISSSHFPLYPNYSSPFI